MCCVFGGVTCLNKLSLFNATLACFRQVVCDACAFMQVP